LQIPLKEGIKQRERIRGEREGDFMENFINMKLKSLPHISTPKMNCPTGHTCFGNIVAAFFEK
jgi:hypothetical protein